MRRLEHAMADGDNSAGHPRPLRRASRTASRTRAATTWSRRSRRRSRASASTRRTSAGRSRSSRAARRTARCSRGRSSPRPDVLLLDEPTNHLDFNAVEFLEEYLARSRRAYLVVTHDRRFLDRVAEEIVDLENGRLTAYSRRLHVLPAAEGGARPDGDARLREAAGVHREGEGVHPPQHRRPELAPGEGAPDEARARRASSRSRRRTRRRSRSGSTRRASAGAASSARGTSTPATPRASRSSADVSFELLRGERLAILGENGTGKTTLLKTLAGRLPPLAGTRRRRGTTSRSATTTRSSRTSIPKKRAIDAVWDQHPEETEEAMRSYLARFAFRGDEVFAPISGLSGGEKGQADARRRHEAAAQPAAPRRADEPPRPRLARGARGVARRISRARSSSSRTTGRSSTGSRRACSTCAPGARSRWTGTTPRRPTRRAERRKRPEPASRVARPGTPARRRRASRRATRQHPARRAPPRPADRERRARRREREQTRSGGGASRRSRRGSRRSRRRSTGSRRGSGRRP